MASDLQTPDEYNGIRFYKYYFLGIEKPVQVEAINKDEARKAMDVIYPQLPEAYHQSKICGETITVPLLGISQKKKDGKTYIWIGPKTADGWIEESKYIRENKNIHGKSNKNREVLYSNSPK